MKTFSSAAALAAVLVLAAPTAAHPVRPSRNSRPGCPKTFTVPMAKRAVYWTYRGSRVVSRRERRTVDRIVRCLRSPHSKPYVRGIERGVRTRWRVRRFDDRITPYGAWAIPSYIVACESTYQNRPPNSAGASGYYQIISSTWAGYGGLRFAPEAYESSKLGQDVVAARIWDGGAGASQWVCA